MEMSQPGKRGAGSCGCWEGWARGQASAPSEVGKPGLSWKERGKWADRCGQNPSSARQAGGPTPPCRRGPIPERLHRGPESGPGMGRHVLNDSSSDASQQAPKVAEASQGWARAGAQGCRARRWVLTPASPFTRSQPALSFRAGALRTHHGSRASAAGRAGSVTDRPSRAWALG